MTQTNFAAGQIPTDATVATAASSLYTKDASYPAGETLSAGEVVFIEPVPTTAQATSAQNIGDVTANTRVTFPVFGSGVAGTTLKLNLAKVGSPSVNLGVRIETDNAGNPSGTLVNANATGTVTAASLTTAALPYVESATDDDTTNIQASSWGGYSSKGGYQIYSKWSQKITTVTKNPGCNAPVCQILDSGWVVIESVSFSGNTATFSTNVLAAGGTYYVVSWNNGTDFIQTYDSTPTFPVNGTNINFLGQYNQGLNIEAVTTQTLTTTVTLSGSITIPAGQKCHAVVFQGTYGSETVNAGNYYKIGYYTNDSTTRGEKLWNGSVYGSMATTVVPYTSSTLFLDKVLSKTDADFTYKIDWLGITQEAVTAGDLSTGKYPTIAIEGVDSNQTGMTQCTTMYLGNTPGSISSSVGTNSKKIGKAITASKLQIEKQEIINPTTSPLVVLSSAAGTKTYTLLGTGMFRLNFSLQSSGGGSSNISEVKINDRYIPIKGDDDTTVIASQNLKFYATVGAGDPYNFTTTFWGIAGEVFTVTLAGTGFSGTGITITGS